MPATTITATVYHGAGTEHKRLKASVCELGFPSGVWVTENHATASTYARRHRNGVVIEGEFSGTVYDPMEQDAPWLECPVATARRAKREGWDSYRQTGARDILIFKTSRLQVTGYSAPDSGTRSILPSNRCSCH